MIEHAEMGAIHECLRDGTDPNNGRMVLFGHPSGACAACEAELNRYNIALMVVPEIA